MIYKICLVKEKYRLCLKFLSQVSNIKYSIVYLQIKHEVLRKILVLNLFRIVIKCKMI